MIITSSKTMLTTSASLFALDDLFVTERELFNVVAMHLLAIEHEHLSKLVLHVKADLKCK